MLPRVAATALALGWTVSTAHAQTTPDFDALRSAGGAGTEVHATTTGGVTFFQAGTPVDVGDTRGFLPPGLDKTETRIQAAQTASQRFLASHADAFGSPHLDVERTELDALDIAHVHMAQRFRGLDVFGAELAVHVDASDDIRAANGHLVPSMPQDLQPHIRPRRAEQIARAYADQEYDREGFEVTEEPELLIYDPGLVRGAPDQGYLAWSVAVEHDADTRALVMVDAKTGIPLDTIATSMDLRRKVSQDALILTTVKWKEGDPVPNDPEIKTLIDAAERSHRVFLNLSTSFPSCRDDNCPPYKSYNGKDAEMHAIILSALRDICPNAGWTGKETVFCPRLIAPDVANHEWSHAYTQFTHNLIYKYEPGALNEAYADVFAELIDLFKFEATGQGGRNKRGENSCSVTRVASTPGNGASKRWLIGEETRIGAIRDVWNPNCLNQPASLTDNRWYCGNDDEGGVHKNSMPATRTFAMLVDGGRFDGTTIDAIGAVKAAHIWFRAQFAYQVPATQMADHALALQQSCTDLAADGRTLKHPYTGADSGQRITSQDCLQLTRAIEATKLTTPTRCDRSTQNDRTNTCTTDAECSDRLDCTTDRCDTGTGRCVYTETDRDADGVADCSDACPNDADKEVPGVCGCGAADDTTDSDGDGLPDCWDLCPNDPQDKCNQPRGGGGGDDDDCGCSTTHPLGWLPLLPVALLGLRRRHRAA